MTAAPRFIDQSIVVTGGGGAIGRAVGLALAAEGATVFAVGRTHSSIQAVARESSELVGDITGIEVDLTDDDAVRRLVSRLEDEPGHVSGLIHAAGAHVLGPIIETPVTELDRLFQINIRAPYLLTQLLLPLLAAVQGQVVFVNTSATRSAAAGLAAYSASKHALRGFADSLREEVNPAGIRVISVYPGRTAGPIQDLLHQIEGRPYRPNLLLQPADVARAIVDAMSMSATAEVTDLEVRPMVKPDER